MPYIDNYRKREDEKSDQERRQKIRRIRAQRRKRRRIIKMRIQIGLALFMVLICIGVAASVIKKQKLKSDAANVNETAANLSASQPKAEGKKIIVIDPGHGGNDPGTMYEGEKDVYEKDINLSICKKIKAVLEERGYEVILTREKDIYISLEERAKVGNQKGVDIFVSIHQNSLENDTVTDGIETWYNKNVNKDSKTLAKCVQRGTTKAVDGEYGGIKADKSLVVIRETKVPSCLIETGFLSNAKERKNLQSGVYQDKLAEGIANGIDDFFKKLETE